jgi:hypothetical protein
MAKGGGVAKNIVTVPETKGSYTLLFCQFARPFIFIVSPSLTQHCQKVSPVKLSYTFISRNEGVLLLQSNWQDWYLPCGFYQHAGKLGNHETRRWAHALKSPSLQHPKFLRNSPLPQLEFPYTHITNAFTSFPS